MDWFRHDCNARNDVKLRKLVRSAGGEALGAYWVAIEALFEKGGKMYGPDLAEELEVCGFEGLLGKLVQYKCLETDGDNVYSERLLREIEYQNESRRKKSEAGKKGNATRWGNRNAIAVQSQCDGIASQSNRTSSQNIAPNQTLPIKEDTSLSKDSSVQKKFRRPTVDEIRDYCRERNNNVDAEVFWNFYESKGWKVGNAPMKSWKACVVTWEKSDGRGRTQGSSPVRNRMATGDDWDHLADENGSFSF